MKPLTQANHGCSWLGSSENYPTFWSLGSHRMLKTNFIHIVPYFRHPTRNPLTSRRGNQKILTYPSALFDEATNLSVFVPFLAAHPFCIFPRLLKHISSRWSANRPRPADHHRQLYTLLTRQPTRLSTPFNLHPSPSFRKRVETGSTVWRCDGVCVCVSSGSVTGQEWAAAAGLQLMTTVSIYLLLNISRIGGDGCFSFSFHFYMSRQAMRLFAVCIVEATECTVHTNRANSFVQQPRDVQNDCNFLVFFR